MNFTPGPWEARKVSGLPRLYDGYELRGPQTDYWEGQPVYLCAGTLVLTNEANARLIAAAPELYEACKIAFANLKPMYSDDHLVMKSLSQALSKVES